MNVGPGVAPQAPGVGNPQSIRVLLYHRVRPDRDPEDPANIAVRESTFRRQIALLDKWGYSAITFDDYRLFLEGKVNLPRRPVVITFDDAYEEIHATAFPILREFGMRAVVFVVADSSLTTSAWDEDTGGGFKLLTPQQMIELHSAGFEIGSHSLTHPNLTAVSADEAWQEIFRSRMRLEILLNAPVRSFAYPFGLVDDALKKMAADAGYTIACAAYTGPPLFGTDCYEIRRIKVIDTDAALQFWLQLHPTYAFYRWIHWKIKRALLWTLTRNQKDKRRRMLPV